MTSWPFVLMSLIKCTGFPLPSLLCISYALYNDVNVRVVIGDWLPMIYLTNRFHVALRLDHRWRQNVVKTKKWHTCITDVWRHLWSITEQTHPHGIYLLNRYNSLEIVGFERLGFHFKKAPIIQSLLYSLLIESFRFWDEDEGERYSVLSSALPWTNVILVGKQDSRRYSTRSFSENNAVAGTSYQILKV